MTIPHIFVVGVGRSGTTLVQSMLAAHPRIIFLPETVFIRRYMATGALNKLYHNGGMDPVIKLLKTEKYLKRLGVPIEKIIHYVQFSSGGSLDLSVYQALVKQYIGAESPQFVGDKDPRLVEYLPLLHHFFPDSRIIHVMRDPRDILESKKRAEWSKNRSPITHVFAGKVQFQLGRKFGSKLFGDHYFELTYEKLIQNPEKALKGLCHRMGLEYDPAMLCFGEAAKRLVADDEMSWKKETLGPLLTSNYGKWKKNLSKWEAALVENICPEAMRAVDAVFQCPPAQLSARERISLKVVTAFLGMASPVYQAYRQFRTTRRIMQQGPFCST